MKVCLLGKGSTHECKIEICTLLEAALRERALFFSVLWNATNIFNSFIKSLKSCLQDISVAQLGVFIYFTVLEYLKDLLWNLVVAWNFVLRNLVNWQLRSSQCHPKSAKGVNQGQIKVSAVCHICANYDICNLVSGSAVANLCLLSSFL